MIGVFQFATKMGHQSFYKKNQKRIAMDRKLQSLKACYALFVCLIVQLDTSYLGYDTDDHTFFLARFNQLITADTPGNSQPVNRPFAGEPSEGETMTRIVNVTDGQTNLHQLFTPSA